MLDRVSQCASDTIKNKNERKKSITQSQKRYVLSSAPWACFTIFRFPKDKLFSLHSNVCYNGKKNQVILLTNNYVSQVIKLLKIANEFKFTSLRSQIRVKYINFKTYYHL